MNLGCNVKKEYFKSLFKDKLKQFENLIFLLIDRIIFCDIVKYVV